MTSTPPAEKKRETSTPSHHLARQVALAMLDKKAADVAVLDMRGISGVADFFVLGTGAADLQIRAIADGVRESVLDEYAERPWHVEGYGERRWVVLDYVDVVAHVFDQERREFYDLERLWADAPKETVGEEATTVAMLDAIDA
ncbi:MAG: ribosome silencing factor [Bacteroidota bacterium]